MIEGLVDAARMRTNLEVAGEPFSQTLAAEGVDVPADAFDPARFLTHHDMVRARLEALEA